ncbi:MAG: chloride channel protein [Actinobacteria bacterium]|nr:chloride channel protein [Actinomycetota bacterium]MBU1492575.1 chloride channel protein [Actinomycetota bacterium]
MLKKLWLAARRVMEPRGTAAFLLVSAVVGVLVGLAAAALIEAIDGLGRAMATIGDHVGSTRVVALVSIPIGLLLAWSIARRFAPEVAGEGVPEAIAAVAIRSGYMPSRAVPLKLIATSLTLGLGGSAGRESPIVQIGATIGSSISRKSGMGEDRVRSLVAAGAGAAIGASFNAPIAGMLFAMEVIIGGFAVRHLNAVVVASVAAAVTTRSIVGEEQILHSFPHRLGDPRELILYIGLGLLAVVVAVLFLNALGRTESLRTRGPGWLRPVLLGLAVGGIAWLEPDVLGTGQGVVGGFLSLLSADNVVWWSVLALAGYKMVASTLTLGAGGFGGEFMPSLFIGAALGTAYATLLAPAWGISNLSPGAFAIVGMAATFAAVARAPLTAIIIAFEITGDYGLVLPLMLAATLATFLADVIHPNSVYAQSLARRGITLTRRSEVDVLDTVPAGDVASLPAEVAEPGMTTGVAQGLLDRSRQHGVAVVEEGRLVGIITVTDIIRTGGPSDQVLVADAMTPKPLTATPSTPVSEVLARMATLGVGRIPIVDEHDPGRLVGIFRREHAVQAYHLALGREVSHDLGIERLRARTTTDAAFHDIEVPAASVADGRLLKEVAMPGGVTVVSVRKGLQVEVPDGNTRLQAGDILTVFARAGGFDQLLQRFNAGDTEELTAISGDDARFYDLEIPLGSVADGRLIKEVAIPGGCTIVSVRRGMEVIVPDGNTRLLSGDVITLFARQDSRKQFAERLRPPQPGDSGR